MILEEFKYSQQSVVNPFLDPKEAVQRQHVRGQVCSLSEGVRGVSAPELQNAPALRQEQRPGATGTTHSDSDSVCPSAAPKTIGSDPEVFRQFSEVFSVSSRVK